MPADIIVFTSSAKTTPKIVLEIKKPKRKDGIEQLRSYLNAEGSPIGVWSNRSERVILSPKHEKPCPLGRGYKRYSFSC